MLFSCRVPHYFLKMGRVSIKMIAANFILSSLFPKELYTFVQMSHVSIDMNFISFDYILIISQGIRHICAD